MRVVNFSIAAVYLVLAFISVNEPHAAIWILINGSMAIVAILAMFSLYLQKVIGGLILILGGYSFFLLNGFLTWMNNPDFKSLVNEARLTEDHIMDARHFLILMASEIILILYFLWSRKHGRAIIAKK